MSNDVAQQIMDALAQNPIVPADTISVEAVDGDVILRGTVGSLVQREEAVRTARHVAGQRNVTDRLRLGLLDSDHRPDADTKAAVLDVLDADDAVQSSDIDVAVRDGAVTLSGVVDLEGQRDQAERDALAVPGVASVLNRLRVVLPVSAGDLAARITDAIGLDAIVGAESIDVIVRDDVVTLSGTVRTGRDRDTAVAVAVASPGVTDVRDELRVMG